MSSLKLPLLVLVLVLVLHLLGGSDITTTIIYAASTKPDPHFQVFNVRATIAGTKALPANITSYQEASESSHKSEKWKLKLVHRDLLSSNNFSDYRRRLDERLKRDALRVATLTSRLSGTRGGGGGGGGGSGAASYEVEDFGSEVTSGMDQGSGEYFVRIGVGSPPTDQYMVIDSGSDIVWVQCQPCSQCYHQSDPVFDPAESASFSGVSCRSSVCNQLENSGCHAGGCRYEVSYGDGSYTKGTLALETLTFGNTEVRNVAIGCGHMNRGMFVGAAGLLGLGGGSMSFVGQLGGQTGGAFGYCLVSRGMGSYGYGSLVFGRGGGAIPVGAAWVPLQRNPRAPSLYYVGLSGLGVGGIQEPISEDILQLSALGDGGVVMDTGTAVTRFPTPVYDALRDAFIAATASLPRASRVSIFDTCYDLSGFETVRVPTVSFYFSGGPILTLPAMNFLIPVDEGGTFCFAFAPSSTSLSIIGNIQQEGIQISFDGSNGFVGFGPNTC
ncbi:protein ASPARTIC PROTEASE IN GUARD CELL 2 [Macadamia integrifolia]|uniref:protein ASPARTIC PROTEASE IN GUARD CELL 2 n=1 Tax=Macadamia integrifolia TaxID=60698 RepID=UPI001C4EAF2A|nr:protein ASPARTIC PROTEASE IN GUARD CELL 2 [Macadamia integrifolia]